MEISSGRIFLGWELYMIKFKVIEDNVNHAIRAARVNKKLAAKKLRRSNLVDFSHIKYIVKGCIIGSVIGALVSLFRIGLNSSLDGLFIIYPYLNKHPKMIILYVLATLVLWQIVARIIKPIYDKKPMSWWSALWRNSIGSLLSIAPGIFAGREGPSIKIGLYSAKGLADKVFHENSDNSYLLMHCGMAAGLGAAFSAPISGTLFLVEAVSVPFTGVLLATSMSASIAAVCVSYLFFGLTPCLYVPYSANLPFSAYWLVLCLGIYIGLISRTFQWVMKKCKEFYANLPIRQEYTLIVPFLLVIPIGLYYPDILGGSHHFINILTSESFISNAVNNPDITIFIILGVMAITRLIFTGFSCGATAPTGIFMPILVLGTTTGAIFALACIHYGLIEPECYINIVICAMAAFFGSALRTPLTAIVLIAETVGSLEMVMPLVIATWAATIVHKLLRGKSLYS